MITNRSNILLELKPSADTDSDNWSGILSYANTQINIFEKAIMIIIFALVKTELFNAL
jgi:hypothetical protein